MDPPAHAMVLSVDEKSQIQALDRTQPGLPIKPGRCGTMTHDYKRNGTTTPFAALDVLDGKVIGRCMQRHRHQEFIRFLNTMEAGRSWPPPAALNWQRNWRRGTQPFDALRTPASFFGVYESEPTVRFLQEI